MDFHAPGRDEGETYLGDVVIPSPSPPDYRRCPRLPEVSLLAAMLKDALRCVQGDRTLARGQAAKAYDWFASEGRDWPFSFLNICDLLEIDATALRERLGVRAEHTGKASKETLPLLKIARQRKTAAKGASSCVV